MKQRFEGGVGRRLLTDTLITQRMVAGNSTLAEELASVVDIMAVKSGETIIRQGDSDNDIYFILAGSFTIRVNGKVVAKRGPRHHVGKMSAIEPAQPRSAAVVADEASVVARLSEARLADLGQRHPDVWRNLAK